VGKSEQFGDPAEALPRETGQAGLAIHVARVSPSEGGSLFRAGRKPEWLHTPYQ
jgi:hypothetical protein